MLTEAIWESGRGTERERTTTFACRRCWWVNQADTSAIRSIGERRLLLEEEKEDEDDDDDEHEQEKKQEERTKKKKKKIVFTNTRTHLFLKIDCIKASYSLLIYSRLLCCSMLEQSTKQQQQKRATIVLTIVTTIVYDDSISRVVFLSLATFRSFIWSNRIVYNRYQY